MKALLSLVFFLLISLVESDLTSVISQLPTCAVCSAQFWGTFNS